MPNETKNSRKLERSAEMMRSLANFIEDMISLGELKLAINHQLNKLEAEENRQSEN